MCCCQSVEQEQTIPLAVLPIEVNYSPLIPMPGVNLALHCTTVGDLP